LRRIDAAAEAKGVGETFDTGGAAVGGEAYRQSKHAMGARTLLPINLRRRTVRLNGHLQPAMDPRARGDKLYVTWNVGRGTKTWDCCTMTVIHIPETDRRPRVVARNMSN